MMSQPSDIHVQRFSEGEITAALYFLLGCLVFAILAYAVGAWMAVRSGDGFFSALTRIRPPRNPLRRIDEGELKPWVKSSRYPLWRRLMDFLADIAYLCFGWAIGLFRFGGNSKETPRCINTTYKHDPNWDVNSVKPRSELADFDEEPLPDGREVVRVDERSIPMT